MGGYMHLLLAIIYLSFISLGLPDAMLGAAWPEMYPGFGVPVSFAGMISATIAVCTVVSSLSSDRLTRRFGTGRVMSFSVALTCFALAGFFFSHTFHLLLLFAIPYGLGAGSVDASLNNYVALHYKSRHMSWLHCMWGVGAATGPYVMGAVLARGMSWNSGYGIIAIVQMVLSCILFSTLFLWKNGEAGNEDRRKALSFSEVFSISGVKAVMLAFFCYCALEQTAMLWSSSYLVLSHGVPAADAASYAGLFFLGITLGRALSGFMTLVLPDRGMIRIGETVIAVGLAILFLSPSLAAVLTALFLLGAGCAPIYPSIIHSTPANFGQSSSQAVIGIEMACAYVGICIMPPFFGVVASRISIRLFPFFIALLLVVMILMLEVLFKKVDARLPS